MNFRFYIKIFLICFSLSVFSGCGRKDTKENLDSLSPGKAELSQAASPPLNPLKDQRNKKIQDISFGNSKLEENQPGNTSRLKVIENKEATEDQSQKPPVSDSFEADNSKEAEDQGPPFVGSKGAILTERKHYPGVVHLTIQDKYKGTAFFISSDTLVTAFHVVDNLKGPVKENLFFLDPVKNIPLAVTEILALDMVADLAVLKTDYHSETFYPVSFSEEKEVLSSQEKVIVLGFPESQFRLTEGRIVENRDHVISVNITHKDLGLSFFGGNSGGPLLSEEGHLKGVLIQHDSFSQNLHSVPVNKLKDVLLKPVLACVTRDCIEEEKEKVFSKALEGDKDSQFTIAFRRYGIQASRYSKRMKNFEAWLSFMDEEERKRAERVSTLIFQIYKRVAHWVHKAAVQGHIEAQFQLGTMYFYGQGVEQDLEEAFNWVHKAAVQGHIEAQFQLGTMYFYGNGVERDLEKAVHWLRKAAGQGGHAEAQFVLGGRYFYGQGAEQDLKEAFRWYRKAAGQGHIEAQFALGGMYFYGNGVEQDLKEAFYWFYEAAGQGNSEAQNYIGTLNESYQKQGKLIKAKLEKEMSMADEKKGKVYSQALAGDKNSQFSVGVMEHKKVQGYIEELKPLEIWISFGSEEEKKWLKDIFVLISEKYKIVARWYNEAADQGYAKAQYNLGLMYFYGNGVEQDLEKAFNCFHKAALQGLPEAQLFLGLMYFNGQGVEQDFKEAARWFHAAAEQGLPEAQFNLGGIYFNGQGVEQDFKEAARWFHAAAEQGHAKAQFNLGGMYFNDQGVEQDFKEAARWFHAAAEQGLPEAQYNLGRMYFNGQGVEKDLEEAVHWFREAARQGLPEAQLFLGMMYFSSQEVEKNLQEAFYWFHEAAGQGLPEAQYQIGRMYFYGAEGVERDFKEAGRWLQEAAEQEHAKALTLIEKINKDFQQMEEDLMETIASIDRKEQGKELSVGKPAHP